MTRLGERPPRGRGGYGAQLPEDVDLRATPVRAGRIGARGTATLPPSDDPRAGGAGVEGGAELCHYRGRSPRGRGGYFVTWGVVT
ncbi:hypothetical protein CRV15_29145 (plasmid) [Streptomyces clavuligerus]|uniref:Uncharacterized protein n=1 Tax=Streptomyces clavuligerus TaxID=1901 RepID=B5GUJ0_STRCL|nr:hypothetical protein SSCG_03240 [Streptomyces clavuligerus]EFG03700.1 Hypothetical protein SCLAV_p0209 [Streptomyces clavuligerus]QCS09701.1 hypothetical protein CRV15_29145 [Streptomyces clavuligerus]QPJ98256.1 hypothetical protein GE265_35235 [Streptomyces clavuligerus]